MECDVFRSSVVNLVTGLQWKDVASFGVTRTEYTNGDVFAESHEAIIKYGKDLVKNGTLPIWKNDQVPNGERVYGTRFVEA